MPEEGSGCKCWQEREEIPMNLEAPDEDNQNMRLEIFIVPTTERGATSISIVN